MTTTNELPKPTESVESKIHKIIRDAFKLGFDCETIDEIDYFDGLSEAEEIIENMTSATTKYAEELQQVAEAVGMPFARGTSVIARVRELVILANIGIGKSEITGK